jgi:MoaE-MoaD fusion protein
LVPVSPRLEIEVQLFASVREAVGRDRVRVTLQPGASAADLLDLLERDHPSLQRARRAFAVAVNHEVVGLGHRLGSGDEVALIPPVGGG